MRKSSRAKLEIALFALGLAALVFLTGMAVAQARWFPYAVLNAAFDAAEDWQENWRHYLGLRSKFAQPTTRTRGGVTVHDPQLAFDGYTFVAAYMSDGYNVYLLDMDGKIAHRWDATFSRIWRNPKHVDDIGGDGNVAVHGAYLYDNGDVVLDFGGSGTAKLDRCSKVLWTVDRNTHHHVEPLADGSVLIPSRVQRDARRPDRPMVNVGASGFYWDDTILHVDADGRVLDEHAIMDILDQSGWASLMLSGPGAGKMVNEEDPLHLNDVEMLTPELASAFPMFEAGDLLVSLRHLNSIFVVEPGPWQVKWVMTGPFLAQHDPDFLPNGHILIYDNRITGDTPKLGNTRLIEIDPTSRKIVWAYEGAGEEAFYAPSRGEQQLLPNGNILIADPYGGRIVEIDRADGNKAVWEWVNLIQPGLVGMVTDVQRLPRAALGWIGQPCPSA